MSGTEESRGQISLDRPNRQWDYPYVDEFILNCTTLTISSSDMLGRSSWTTCLPLGADVIDFRPPHQIMTWVGLERYGYLEEAQRLAYRFLYMCVPRHHTRSDR